MSKRKTVRLRNTDINKALLQAERYAQNLLAESEEKYKPFEEAIDVMKQFLNKNGTVSKSKTRSKKAKVMLNEAAAEALAIGSSAKKRKQNQYNLAVTGAAEGLQKKIFGGNASKSQTAAALLVDRANAIKAKKKLADRTKDKMKWHVPSDVIITLTDAGFTIDEAMDVINHLENDINNSTPSELQHFSSEDDISVFVDNVVNLRELYPNMSVSDAIEISDYMTDYGFDDYENIASDWGYE